MTVKLGRLEIDSPLVLAPIAGYTDSPYRRIARRYGCGFSVTELISAEGIIRRNKKTMDLFKFDNEERTLGIQIFGRKPDVMAEAATIVESFKPDFIDINMGCPARKVCKDGEGAGAALLRDPVLIEQITARVVSSVSLPVSAKIRTGWDFASKNFRDVIKALQNGGISFITIHGRTKTQGYSGNADWNDIAEAASFASVPVIGNGDIRSHEEAMRLLASTPCAAVMIGRAACSNPWIFSAQLPTRSELIAQIKEHLDMNIAFYGDWGLVLMRKHIVAYIRSLYRASAFRTQLCTAPNRESVLEILEMIEKA